MIKGNASMAWRGSAKAVITEYPIYFNPKTYKTFLTKALQGFLRAGHQAKSFTCIIYFIFPDTGAVILLYRWGH